jgi:FMN-dependent NADH-azoreductase
MALNILAITASGRTGSVSNQLVAELVAKLQATQAGATLVQHDVVANPLSLVDDAWISGAYTPVEARSAEQIAALKTSNELVAELLAADVLVLGVPIYNFGIPAALKGWIDQIVRVGVTFAYGADGQPKGLVPAGKKAYLALASGGVPAGSGYDLATSYLKLVLGFIGITDVTVIAADQLVTLGAGQVDKAKAQIAALSA